MAARTPRCAVAQFHSRSSASKRVPVDVLAHMGAGLLLRGVVNFMNYRGLGMGQDRHRRLADDGA